MRDKPGMSLGGCPGLCGKRGRFFAQPLLALGLALLLPAAAAAELPTHPIFTEAFLDPDGNDGPIGTIPNVHQEFIEIYLPTAAALEVGLSADNLNLTLYDIEGDFANLSRGHVNWRIDLPTFDLDPGNGLTPGAIARPSTGLVVLGWLDYLEPEIMGDPPIDLAGTPSTRIPLVNLESPPVGFTFIGINGNQFGGTTNFPTPVAISHIDLAKHPYSGFFENGSGAMLMMNRDDPSYVELCSVDDPAICNTNADLANGALLPIAPLLDAWASNDHPLFDPALQPYSVPTGDSIDLESELQSNGVYSLFTPQVAERGEGYSREFLDVQKTTEDAIAFNEDPAVDSSSYQGIDIDGPFLPTPGAATYTTDGANLSVLIESTKVIEVLTNTTARPSPKSANIGGNFGMSFSTTPYEMLDAPNITFAGTTSDSRRKGQVLVYPEFEVSVSAKAVPGETALVATLVNATPAEVDDPTLGNASAFGITTVRAVNPITGKDAQGAPFQATTLIALVGLKDDALVTNEFAASDLGQYIASAGRKVADSGGKRSTLVDPETDLSSSVVVEPLIASLPTEEADYIDETGPVGKKSLVQTVATSAEVLAGGVAYVDSFNAAGNLLKARRFINNSTEGAVWTSGKPAYTPRGEINYVDAGGRVEQGSGFWKVTTQRDFEIAILETNLEGGLLESGSKDDFGIILKVATVFAGSPVVPGEFVFLSMMGGREGADIDTLRIPPDAPALMNVILIDLDPLATELGVEKVSDVYLVDANGESEIDPLEIFYLSVPEPSATFSLATGVMSLAALASYRRRGAVQIFGREGHPERSRAGSTQETVPSGRSGSQSMQHERNRAATTQREDRWNRCKR